MLVPYIPRRQFDPVPWFAADEDDVWSLLSFAPELVFGRRRRGCVLIRLAAAREVQLVRQRRVVRVIELIAEELGGCPEVRNLTRAVLR